MVTKIHMWQFEFCGIRTQSFAMCSDAINETLRSILVCFDTTKKHNWYISQTNLLILLINKFYQVNLSRHPTVLFSPHNNLLTHLSPLPPHPSFPFFFSRSTFISLHLFCCRYGRTFCDGTTITIYGLLCVHGATRTRSSTTTTTNTITATITITRTKQYWH